MKEEEKPEPGSFLHRWSRRKRGLDDEPSAPLAEALADRDGGDAAPEGAASGEEATEEPAVEKDFSDFDFDKLDYESDYKQFMDKDVSQEARNKALRKLWVSNPVLANMDGLDDYCEDYTDAAVCLPKGTMKTLYRYGRGFLDDDEVAEWEALGQETKEPAKSEAEEPVEIAEAGDSAAASADADADTGPGAACAAAVRQDEAEMLAECEAEAKTDTADPPDTSKA